MDSKTLCSTDQQMFLNHVTYSHVPSSQSRVFCDDVTRFLADDGALNAKFVWEELVAARRGREEGHPLRAGMARRGSASAGGAGQVGWGRRVGGVGEASKIGEAHNAAHLVTESY